MVEVIVFNHKLIVQVRHLILRLRLHKINNFMVRQDPSVGSTVQVAVVRGLNEVVPVFHLVVQIHLKVVQLSWIAEIVVVLLE